MSFVFVSFFARFPEFDHRPRCNVREEFNRLAKQQKWSEEVTKRMRAECYNQEFEAHFANLELSSQLERLQHLCVELDVEPLGTITQCKKALKNVHVNIIDLMDARRTGNKVKKFTSNKQLVNYTRKTKKYYPKEKAKCDVIKVLLRGMFSHH